MHLFLIAVFALLLLLLPIGLYVFGGFSGPLSTVLSDWASFGDYFGGVAGPTLSFVTVLLLISTLKQQAEANELIWKEQLASQHIRHLSELLSEINLALDEDVTSSGGLVKESLRTILSNEHPTYSPRDPSSIPDFVQLVFDYCQAVALYRDNITRFYDCKAYERRGQRLIALATKHPSFLATQEKIKLEFADMHIKGEQNRAERALSI